MAILEKDIEAGICDYAKANGLLVYKFTSPARRGVPDRMFVLPQGRIFFIEMKAPGNKPTPAQEREHFRLRQAGITVYWTDSVERGIKYIDREIEFMKSNAKSV